MSDEDFLPDPAADFDEINPLRPDAVRVTGMAAHGKPCELINNSGEFIPDAELQALLDGLIAEGRFGFKSLSAAGGATLDPQRREAAHVQIGDRLYRLLVLRYTARLERF